MDAERHSRTAHGVALHRAAHQLLDRPPIFADPLALAVVGTRARRALEADPLRWERRPFADRLRAFLAVRSRLAEDALAAAVAGGVTQYVVLGAGLDTFALRDPYGSLRVFEVDHPATQAWKRRLLAEAGLAPPPSLAFVPVDFERQDLAHELAAAGFDPSRGAAVAWLGVVPYLERDAVLATLQWAAGAVGDAGVLVFDYGAPAPRWHIGLRLAAWRLASRVAAAGEPFRTLFRPAELAEVLRGSGFGDVEDLDGDALTERFCSGRADGLKVGGLAHVVVSRRGVTEGGTRGT